MSLPPVKDPHGYIAFGCWFIIVACLVTVAWLVGFWMGTHQ